MVAFALLCVLFIRAIDEWYLPGRFEDRKADVVPKAAITLKLRFGEPLFGGAVVRKYWMLFLVVEDVGGFVAGERGLYVDHGPGILWVLGIDNRAHDAVGGAVFSILLVLQRAQIESHFHSEINASLADGHTDASKVEGAVFFTVTNHDIAATAANEFVQPHVVKVAAVAEIDVVT